MFKWFRSLKEIKKTNTGELCDCTGDILIENMKQCEYFPLISGHHTSFMIGTCESCHGFSAFPSDNLQLALKEGTEDSINILKELGLTIDNS